MINGSSNKKYIIINSWINNFVILHFLYYIILYIYIYMNKIK